MHILAMIALHAHVNRIRFLNPSFVYIKIGLPRSSVANKMMNDGVLPTVEDARALLDMDAEELVPIKYVLESDDVDDNGKFVYSSLCI